MPPTSQRNPRRSTPHAQEQRHRPLAIGTSWSVHPAPDRRRSDDLDGNSVGVGGERFDVGSVTGEDRPAGLGESDDERIDSGASSGESPKLGCSPCCRLADRRVDDAGLQESVSVGVASWVAVQRFDEHHRRHDGRPQLLCPEGSDERHSSLGSPREARQSATVENEHGSTDSVERAISNASCNRVRCRLPSRTGFADLGNQFVEVPIRLRKGVLSLQLGSKCDLEKLRGWKVALFQLLVEVVGEVHLNAWHAPNYTPIASAYQRATLALPTRPRSALEGDPRTLSRGPSERLWLERRFMLVRRSRTRKAPGLATDLRTVRRRYVRRPRAALWA